MQISGINLLASQQMAQAAPARTEGLTAMLQKAAGFTPRDLTETPPATHAAPAAPGRPSRPGLHIDLKV